MGDEAALLKNKVSICKGYHEVIETRLKETDDLLAPGDVDPVKKLPRDIALSISRKIPEDAWNLSSIMKELGEELRAREHTVGKTGNNDPKNREYYKRSEDRRHKENDAKRPPGPLTTTAMTSHTSSSRCCYYDVISGTSSNEESFETFLFFRDMVTTVEFNLRKYVCSGMSPEVGRSFIRIGLCESGMGRRNKWSFLDSWTELISTIHNSEPVTIRMCCFSEIDASRQCRLVRICDSSVKAYAVVYLQGNDSNQKMSFVVSKTRVAPIKHKTIPRLDLLGALLLAQLISSVYVALKMEMNLIAFCMLYQLKSCLILD
uniref:Uncharacterized protein n=1 Tax=Amphimedon queenslandica TaxID=400682 RepID=A0A1X7UCG7_AMPQE